MMKVNEYRKGYKKSKVGWIPNEWGCLRFSEVFNRASSKVDVQSSKSYREIGIRSHGKGIFHKPEVIGESLGDKRVFHICIGALVFNIVFAWEQAVALISEDEKDYIASHRFPMFLGKKAKAYEPFFHKFFLTPKGKYLLNLASPGGAGRNKTLGKKELDELNIPLPPLLEQKKIAKILSTWDQTIEKLEKLIELKGKRKKGLMQQLLTGKKRLPGFGKAVVYDGEIPEGWKTYLIQEISDIKFSNVDKKSYDGQNPVTLCNYTDVYKNDYITHSIAFMQATASKTEIEKFSLSKNDVIITKDSETPNDIGIPTVVLDELENVVCGYHLALIRPKPDIVDGVFLSKKFCEPHVQYLFSTLANGATRFGLSTSSIKHLEITIPELSEQIAIRKVLFSQDDEVKFIKNKIANLKEQKKGLIQKLLTGEIRVKVEEEKYV
jgi:type I restriction enzyme, S subunit